MCLFYTSHLLFFVFILKLIWNQWCMCYLIVLMTILKYLKIETRNLKIYLNINIVSSYPNWFRKASIIWTKSRTVICEVLKPYEKQNVSKEIYHSSKLQQIWSQSPEIQLLVWTLPLVLCVTLSKPCKFLETWLLPSEIEELGSTNKLIIFTIFQISIVI